MEKYLNFPIVILSAFIIRLLITGAGLGDSLVIIGLSSLYAFNCYLQYKQEPVANKELINRVVELEEQVRITKENISSVKLGVSLKR